MRPRPAGGSWSRSCGGWTPWCIWPSRPRDGRPARHQEAPKNDRADARHLRELLLVGRLPESWIPPDHVLDLRARVRLRHTLSAQRSEWQQRIQAVLYHHGLPQRQRLATREGRRWLESRPLPMEAREQITVALSMIDFLELQLCHPLDLELRSYARRQTCCKAFVAHYGVGALTSVTILAELGDCRRLCSSRKPSAMAAWNITVYQSDRHRAPGRLSRQGPPALRWALYEASQTARQARSPDHADYLQLAERLGGNRACLVIARKLLKRCYHTLRELGEDALQLPRTSGEGGAAARRASSYTQKLWMTPRTKAAYLPG